MEIGDYFYMTVKSIVPKRVQFIVYKKIRDDGFFPGEFKAVYSDFEKKQMANDYPGIKEFGK